MEIRKLNHSQISQPQVTGLRSRAEARFYWEGGLRRSFSTALAVLKLTKQTWLALNSLQRHEPPCSARAGV